MPLREPHARHVRVMNPSSKEPSLPCEPIRSLSSPTPSPFAVLDATFRLLVAIPPGLSVNGRRMGHGLPRRRIRLDELRELLTHPAVHPAARSAALRHLARRASAGDPLATVALAGVLLPTLRQVAGRLGAAHPGVHPADIEAAVLAAFKHLLSCQRHPRTTARPWTDQQHRPATSGRSTVWLPPEPAARTQHAPS